MRRSFSGFGDRLFGQDRYPLRLFINLQSLNDLADRLSDASIPYASRSFRMICSSVYRFPVF